MRVPIYMTVVVSKARVDSAAADFFRVFEAPNPDQ